MNPLNSAYLTTLKKEKTRAITAENLTGAKGAGGRASSGLGPGRKGHAWLELPQGKTVTLADINEGPGEIRHLWITVTDKTEKDFFVLRDLVIRMYWDGEQNPSVEAPLGDFFCNGFGVKTRINSLPIVVLPHGGMNCYFPMPFSKRAKITIENQHAVEIQHFFFQIDYALLPSLPEDSLRFHAQWRRESVTVPKKDYTIAELKGTGHYVGTYMAWSILERNWYGEGEVKFYLDGDLEFPTICGTGTEDYFGGAWGFVEIDGEPEQEYNSPFLGHPRSSNPRQNQGNAFDDKPIPEHGFYRWHLNDPICFEKDLRATVQQIGLSKRGLYERQDDISSVAYWYQAEPHAPFPVFPSASARWPR